MSRRASNTLWIALRSLIAIGCAAGLLAMVAGCGTPPSSPQPPSAVAKNTIEKKAQKGPVKLSVRVTPREARLSDLVEMDVIVEAEPKVETKPPAFGQAVGDFLIRDYSERPAEAGAGNIRRYHYQLEPAHAGKHLIRSVSIEFLDKRLKSDQSKEAVLIETDPIEVNVTSEFEGAAPSLGNLEPMVPPRPVHERTGITWAVGLIAAIVVTLLALRFVRRRNRAPAAPRPLTPEEVAHKALAELLAEDLPARGLFKEFYLRLTGIVRHYVEDTTGLRAPEQTTEEFLRDMRSRTVFPLDRSNRLSEFLEAADLVKYAGQEPGPGQIEQAVARAQEFVNLNRVEPAAMAGASAG
jgi:hypothetical protein